MDEFALCIFLTQKELQNLGITPPPPPGRLKFGQNVRQLRQILAKIQLGFVWQKHHWFREAFRYHFCSFLNIVQNGRVWNPCQKKWVEIEGLLSWNLHEIGFLLLIAAVQSLKNTLNNTLLYLKMSFYKAKNFPALINAGI